MELIVGPGFYKDVKATLIHDPNHEFIQECGTDHIFFLDDHPNQIDPEYESNIQDHLAKDFEIKVSEAVIDPEKPDYGTEGYMYLRTSIGELRACKNDLAILIQLTCPKQHNDVWHVDMTVHLKSMGYAIDEETFVKSFGDTADAHNILWIPCDWLFSMPGPSGPMDIDIPDYLMARTFIRCIDYAMEV